MRAAIVLAAGDSRRFGRGDKLLALLEGRPLLLHAIDRAREARPGRLIVVVGPRRAALVRLARRVRRVVLVRARDAREGLGASLAAGLAALRPIDREVWIFLGDMPFARAPRLRLAPDVAASRPFVGAQPGHPVLARSAAARAAITSGDRGLRLSNVGRVRGAAGNLIDIDSRAALACARRRGSGALARR